MSKNYVNVKILIRSSYTDSSHKEVSVEDVLSVTNIEAHRKISGNLLVWFGMAIEINGKYINIDSFAQKINAEILKEYVRFGNKPLNLWLEFKERLKDASKKRHIKSETKMLDRVNEAFKDTYFKIIRESEKIKFYEQLNNALNTSLEIGLAVEEKT